MLLALPNVGGLRLGCIVLAPTLSAATWLFSQRTSRSVPVSHMFARPGSKRRIA